MGVKTSNGDNNNDSDGIRIDEQVDLANGVNYGNSKSGDKEQVRIPTMGFTSDDLHHNMVVIGSDYTTKMGRAIEAAYAQIGNINQTKPNVIIMDKASRSLAYSLIIIAIPSPTITKYYLVLLEATGVPPMTVQEMHIALSSQQPMNAFTTDDALDSVLYDQVLQVLGTTYKQEGMSFESVDGLIVPASLSVGDITAQAQQIAAIAYNALSTELGIDTKQFYDLNIAKAREEGVLLKIDSRIATGADQTIISNNSLELSCRKDWELKLVAQHSNQQTYRSLNLANGGKDTITSVAGMIDAIPVTLTGPSGVQETKCHPHIIITSHNSKYSTIGYTLLSIITATVMTNKDMYLAALTPTDAKVNIGALNLLTNLEHNPNGIGKSLANEISKAKPNQVFDIIDKIFPLPPVLSMDIASFAADTGAASVLATAASPTTTDNKINALTQIINTAVGLTGGYFPKDFSINSIFTNAGIVIPMGTWNDTSRERDLRDIDLKLIASRGDTESTVRWAMSQLPFELSGRDPYIEKLDILSKYVPEATMTRKAVRVTFTQDFISCLMTAAVQAGLIAKYDPEVTLGHTSSLSQMHGFMNHAGLSQGAASFARQQTNNVPNFSHNLYTPRYFS